MAAVHPLKPEALRRTCDPKFFSFATTEDLPPLNNVIGQQRAVKSIAFGLNLAGPGYHIFATGPEATGKTTIVGDLVRRHARRRPAPDDWCLVHNFTDPHRPVALRLPAGQGAALAEQMDRLVDDLRQRLPRTVNTRAYQQRRAAIEKEYRQKTEALLEEIERKAAALGLGISRTNEGVVPVVLADGAPMTQEKFQALPRAQRERIQRSIRQVHRTIAAADRKADRAGQKMSTALERLRTETVCKLVRERIKPLAAAFAKLKPAAVFIEAAEADLCRRLNPFIDPEFSGEEDGETPDADFFRRYRVNLLADRRSLVGAPVVFEPNPTHANIFGRIERRRTEGAVETDHLLVQGGALLEANGGYLILEIESVLTADSVWEPLKRALANGRLVIEDDGAAGLGASALRPAPIDLEVKVVLLGGWEPFYLLQNYDSRFNKLFRVRADFDDEVARRAANVRQYARFVSRVCREEGLRPFSAAAVAAVVEYGQVLTGDQRKLSLRLGFIVGLLKEADYWARQDRSATVEAAHVGRAVAQHRFRHNLTEEKIHQAYLDGTILIDVDGAVIGQVNALAVYQIGELAFGRPTRITAEVYAGEAGVLNVEREADLSGSSHDKGVMILSGWLGRTFARNHPLNLSISITFEQNYSGIDGDSASSSELYAVLSSLAQVPIRQGIAATGSVNQKGQIQAIGGVNEKIEGYFEVCRSKGLTGGQGVIIPRANVANLMLNAEVVEAVRQKQFHVWAVETVEQGIEILTGMPAGRPDAEGAYPAGTLYQRVQENLAALRRATGASA
ncbi:MAG TPA: ATP-binding protein [Desulfobacteraceae bacterium]|nr:AAA family ATPase [Deltaproteobacteria bacterium]HDI61265.1 ATP-binding protein [Desulfobacteraceae bacterium]